jgi:hypothetical protein
MSRGRALASSLLAVLAVAACSPPASPRAPASGGPPAGPASHATEGEYAAYFPFARGEVGLERAVRARRPAMVVFTADG